MLESKNYAIFIDHLPRGGVIPPPLPPLQLPSPPFSPLLSSPPPPPPNFPSFFSFFQGWAEELIERTAFLPRFHVF